MVSEYWIRFIVIFDESNEVTVEDLLRNIWNNGIIPVRPTYLARLDTMIEPGLYWKELSFIPLYHFYRFVQKNALYIKYIDKLQSGPPLDHFTAHPYGDMRPYVCIVIQECIFLPKLIEISWNYLCNQLPKVEKLKKGENSD